MIAPTPIRDRSNQQPMRGQAAISYDRLRKEAEARRIAQELLVLTESAAWVEVISPKLQELRDTYADQLIDATLGAPVKHFEGGSEVAPEVLAARVRSIDWLFDTITTILKAGEVASGRMDAALAELPHTPTDSVI